MKPIPSFRIRPQEKKYGSKFHRIWKTDLSRLSNFRYFEKWPPAFSCSQGGFISIQWITQLVFVRLIGCIALYNV